MSKKRKILIVILILLTIPVFIRRTKSFLFLNSNSPVSPAAQISNPTIPPTPESKNISTTILIGDQTIHTTAKSGATLYDILISAQKNGQINFAGKIYPGLGFFVTDINELHNGGGKYLFYYINGVEASVGVSLYVPKDGDTILWKLK